MKTTVNLFVLSVKMKEHDVMFLALIQAILTHFVSGSWNHSGNLTCAEFVVGILQGWQKVGLANSIPVHL